MANLNACEGEGRTAGCDAEVDAVAACCAQRTCVGNAVVHVPCNETQHEALNRFIDRG